MGYDRGSEPRRSLSGGRSRNYVPRRSARANYRSPDRPYRCADYQRRAYRNRSPDYGGKYRRRSPSGTRYGRDPRPYGGGRNAPYRHSRSRSPLSRRSRSAESVYRNERYTRNEVPSARFGSRASYLRLREANRAPSRSPSRAGRRKSPLRGEQAGRRDTRHRSDSRGRYRERRDERMKNYVSPGPESRTRRAVDQCDPPSNRDDTRRTDKHVAVHCSEGRSVSQHSRSRRPSPRISRGRKISPPNQRARSQARLSKCSRSASRSASWARSRHATATNRRSPINEGRLSRRSGSAGGEGEAPSTSRQSHAPEGSLTRRSPIGLRRENETPTRHSPGHDKGTRRLSSADSTLRTDGAPRRSPRSGDLSQGASRSESREKVVVETSKHTAEAEAPSRSRSLCRSADCPTPDLVSSRPCNAGSKGTTSARHSLGRQEKRTPEQEPSPKRAEDSVSREGCADDGPAELPRRRSAVCSGARQFPSVSRSPPVRTMALEGERDEGKEHGHSCPATPPVTEQPVPERSGHLPEENALSRDHGVCDQKRTLQEEDHIQEQDELPTRVEDQPPPSVAYSNRSSPTQRLDGRRHSERRGHGDGRCDGRSVEASGTNIAAASIHSSRTTREPAGPRAKLASEEDRRNAEIHRTIVKRRIVATEPLASIEAAEVYRAYREPSPRGYPRAQHIPRERGGRFLPAMHRFQPVSPNAWHRVDRDDRLDFSQPLHPVNPGRSVRLVARRGDRNLLITAQQHFRNATPNFPHGALFHNGMFQHPLHPNQRHLNRTPIHIHPAAGRNRKTAANVGRGLQERRNMAAAASNADGKWSHDLFEQLSNEPERKRRRFNLYGETLERVDD